MIARPETRIFLLALALAQPLAPALILAPTLTFGLASPAAAQTVPSAATLVTPAPAPADWTAYQFRGMGFSLPAGWVEMQRNDEQVILFGGSVETRTGPGFGLMLTDDPTEIFDPEKVTETGLVQFENGQLFRRVEATETPEPGLTISGEILVSQLPFSRQDYLVILQSAYSETVADHRAVFDQILSSLTLPAPGEILREPVLGGAFLAPLPEGWETGSYNDSENLGFEQRDLQGEMDLYRHPADTTRGWLDAWGIPEEVQPLPVLMLDQPALLYEWTHAPKSFADGSDADAITRVYVFETCLPGGDTASLQLTGLPSFYDALPVQSLLDAITLPLGDGAAPCAAANLPKGAVIGAPFEGRRRDSGYTSYIPAEDQPDWAPQTYAGHSFALPTGWTGGDNGQGAVVFLSSTGQYQFALTHQPQPRDQRTERAEIRLADGTRFAKFKTVEGETLVSLQPTDAAGHLVIDVTGGQLGNDTFRAILATLRLAAPPAAAPLTATALNGLVTYTVPDGWHALVDADSVTLMAADGRGFLTVAKGKAVLPPYGLAAQVPQGNLGSFAASHFKEWTEYGWEGTMPEFMDGDQPATGWHFLHILRGCLPGQEPVALSWGGISRFLQGQSLQDLQNDLVFAWPDPLEDCALENAGVGMEPAAAEVAQPAPQPAPQPVPEPTPEPTPQPQPAPAPLIPPPPPPQMTEEAPLADPDSFVEGEAGYTLYQNARYGTFISYPATYFIANPAPDSGDGRSFLSQDGLSRFLVFAQYNALDLSQAEMMQQDIAMNGYDDVTYKKSGDGWYVLSGHVAEDIFYRKVLLDPTGLVQVFEILYPTSLKEGFDPVVSFMAKSFGPTASAAPPQPKTNSLPGVQLDKLTTPARNTALRGALMDAARVPIEAEIGQKVIFVVSVLRTDGTWAYLQAQPRSPDGGTINWAKTPFAKEMKQGVMSDTAMILMRRTAAGWQVVDHIFGPTDVYWFAWVDQFNLPEALFTP